MEKDKFLRELKALLVKHNASISFEVGDCSDTYGIFDEKMVIEINEKTVFSCNGWTIDGNDL